MNGKLKKLLSHNINALENSKMDFRSIYDITFSNDGIIAEDTDGFRIHSYTYAQIRLRIEKASCALYEKIGATHSFVALEMENSINWIVAFWAILRSGNKPYLVNCRHPESLKASALKTLGIKYIVGNAKSSLEGEFIDVSTLSSDNEFDCEFENEIALSTSATSLREAICIYTGQRLSAQILNIKSFIKDYPEIATQYNGRIKNLAFLPFYHVFGLIAVYFWFTFFAQTVVFLKDYSSDTILKTCRKHEVTHIFAVPLLWHTIENAIMKKASLDGEEKLKKLKKGIRFCTRLQNIFPHFGMKAARKIMSEVTDSVFGKSVMFCISGGSYIRESALELINAMGYNLHNGYGMSEIGITSVDLRVKPKHKNLNSIGKPFASVEYKINSEGILTVKGTSICERMIVDGEPVCMEGYFDTGDTMEEKDGYYYINGRAGDIIIGENGENINPDLIEKCFNIREAQNICVIGMGNEGNKQVSMIVQLESYMSLSARNRLLDKIMEANETLPITSRVMKIYYTTDSLTSAGAVKVSRSYVLRGIENGEIAISDYKKSEIDEDNEETYSKELLEKVRSIVAKRLCTDPSKLDIHAHLMLDLGADSMQYFAVLTDLAEEFSVSASEKTQLRYTVHEFCQYIERHM